MIQAEGPVAWLPSKSMRCPNCSTENPQGARFCIQCATPFKRVCPKCGFENPPEARFCAQCATSLTGLEVAQSSKTATPSSSPIRVEAENLEPPSDGERKTVTVLFADIKGSMELIEDLDPEEARAIVDPALKLMMEAVHRYDGYVAQSTGDGIFALFGAPAAHEDHPQRALYAALRIQESLRRYSDRIRAEGRLPVQVRVGVNTGEVVVRTIQTGEAHREYVPIGHATSLAARMQALASVKDVHYAEGLVRFGPDPDVLCLTVLSDILFTLGYPDQSLRRSREATEVVQKESDPFSFAMAMSFVVQAHCARGEGRKAEELCHRVIKLCNECGFPFWLAVANRCLSWATLLQGRLDEGIAMINAQFDANDTDSEIARFNPLQFLAEAYGRLGSCERGFAALEQWRGLRSGVSAAGMDRSYHRIRGELLMRAGDIGEAEKCLLNAVQLSASQGAKSEQLRSAILLAKLLGSTNRRDQGRAMLAEIYNWFTEGFDTGDLKDAKSLLNELSE